ncbi:DUF2089 domain-containing protein [Saccharopolyspora sp. K220]|uniref:DUF2089 domain-containing protein n=1 Tax=Saccharopolyspora soli TaxID=2926618 RepID=UPI001F5695FD|nr:DUF2089 domain-containing protein [Saccharopolyspora soli]MCI2417857.1 DUF2089 domain-containing protein [Saccharopolyspora soli]
MIAVSVGIDDRRAPGDAGGLTNLLEPPGPSARASCPSPTAGRAYPAYRPKGLLLRPRSTAAEAAGRDGRQGGAADQQEARRKRGLKKIKIVMLKVDDEPGTTLDMTKQAMDWQELTNLTRGQPFVVERVRLADSGIAIEGEFELPQLAQLNAEDQIFIMAFVRSHGSIKEMERIFGVSYPTIKSRLNRITQLLDFVETDPAPSQADIIDRLRRGEITAEQAVSKLESRT